MSRESAPLRIAIVDDELLARNVLREYLAGIEHVEIVAECANGFEAVKVVAEMAPDLLLLDVQMPKLTGFEVLELVGRDGSLVEYRRRDLRPAERGAKALRHVALLPWFVRNVAVKLAIAARVPGLARLLGHDGETWPY